MKYGRREARSQIGRNPLAAAWRQAASAGGEYGPTDAKRFRVAAAPRTVSSS
jgi:hypothetical protein